MRGSRNSDAASARTFRARVTRPPVTQHTITVENGDMESERERNGDTHGGVRPWSGRMLSGLGSRESRVRCCSIVL